MDIQNSCIFEASLTVKPLTDIEKMTKGRFEETFKQDVNSDVNKAIELLSKGFYPVENNTALEHTEGGYVKVSKRVTNYLISQEQ